MFPETKCESCPRKKTGKCFSQISNTKNLCDGYASGNLTYHKLLSGEIEPVQVKYEQRKNYLLEINLFRNYIKTCIYRDCSSCSASVCYAGLRGYHPPGSKSITTYVSTDDCIDCLKNRNTNKSKNIMIDENQKS